MIDINLIRNNREIVKENIKKKFQDEKLPLVDEVYELDIKYRDVKKTCDDLRYENGRVITDYTKRAKTDKSLNGLKTLCKRSDQLALEKVDAIIRNTYKTLLSRAMKGCFVYCTDSALSIYLKERIRENKELMESFKKSIKLG